MKLKPTCQRCSIILTTENRKVTKDSRVASGKCYNNFCISCYQIRASEHLSRSHIKNPLLEIYSGAEKRAKRDQLEFTITLEDLHIPPHCPYLGIELIVHERTRKNPEQRRTFHPDSPSLDRIDSSKGYTPDNIEIISVLANMMKNVANKEQLLAFANNVIKRYS
jgi:hypothetical protein